MSWLLQPQQKCNFQQHLKPEGMVEQIHEDGRTEERYMTSDHWQKSKATKDAIKEYNHLIEEHPTKYRIYMIPYPCGAA